jgi:hypothetical protein
MSPIDLLQAVQRRPFEPFRVQVSDGTTYDVRHPDLVMVGLGAIIIGVPAIGQPRGVYERAETVSLSHIVKLLPLEATAPTSGNGPPRA